MAEVQLHIIKLLIGYLSDDDPYQRRIKSVLQCDVDSGSPALYDCAAHTDVWMDPDVSKRAGYSADGHGNVVFSSLKGGDPSGDVMRGTDWCPLNYVIGRYCKEASSGVRMSKARGPGRSNTPNTSAVSVHLLLMSDAKRKDYAEQQKKLAAATYAGNIFNTKSGGSGGSNSKGDVRLVLGGCVESSERECVCVCVCSVMIRCNGKMSYRAVMTLKGANRQNSAPHCKHKTCACACAYVIYSEVDFSIHFLSSFPRFTIICC